MKRLVVIGPTASGKSSFCHEFADWLKSKDLAAGLVNLDAFQLFEGMDAGTAKPSKEEQRIYQYALIDLLSPSETLDAEKLATLANASCEDLERRNMLPICVGGSGLYLKSFLTGLDSLPSRDEKLRHFFRECAAAFGWGMLHSWLKALDPVRAFQIHPNDSVRTERALELFFLTGMPYEEHIKSTAQKKPKFHPLNPTFVVHIDCNSDLLKARIESRIKIMLRSGWMREVFFLREKYGSDVSKLFGMRSIGYNEILDYIGNIKTQRDLEELELREKFTENDSNSETMELVSRISTLSWQYARKQKTWFSKTKSDTILLWAEVLTHQKNDYFEFILKSIL